MGRYLITAALPYANGPIHIGHIAGAYLPADIYYRYRKMKGDDVIFICGTDEHGVPITIRAIQENTTPEEVVKKYHENIKESFRKMSIEFDNFSGTHREVHFKISQEFFLNLVNNGYTVVKEQEQFYCDNEKMFLPDRYITGKCPKCSYEYAKGDQCERCGSTLDPTDLVDPKCAICNSKPVMKTTKHWYFVLKQFEKQLREYLESKLDWKPNVRDFALSWINEGLKDRPISRDLDWGIPIPLEEAKGKVMYVWFEAPIGYISSTVEWAQKIGQPDKWKEYWLNPETKLIHFIGKDNIPFHAIIWPATLLAQKGGWILPYNIPANEFMNLEGEKISTSRNWAIWVDDIVSEFNPDAVRYYLCLNMPETKDANFYWREFQEKVNEELANAFGNLVSRVLKFLNSKNDGIIPSPNTNKYSSLEQSILKNLEEIPQTIGKLLDKFEFRQAIKYLREIAFLGNKYVDEAKIWTLMPDTDEFNTKLFVAVQVIFTLGLAMYPFMPTSSKRLLMMLGYPADYVKKINWDEIGITKVKTGVRISKDIEPLFTKIPDEVIEKQVSKLKYSAQKENIETIPTDELIDIDYFKKIDLRVARVKEASRLPKSKKLLKLLIEVGNMEKQIIAGIGQYYNPEDVVGKEIIIVNNLKPATIMGETSYGMLLAAKDDKGKLVLITVDEEIDSGSRIS
ncbi:MAG: methionine--tRNA ligase [Brevinematales bacterium]|nr:methionine--tRNA ligase [Brevinematales bacterium]